MVGEFWIRNEVGQVDGVSEEWLTIPDIKKIIELKGTVNCTYLMWRIVTTVNTGVGRTITILWYPLHISCILMIKLGVTVYHIEVLSRRTPCCVSVRIVSVCVY